VSRVGSSTSPSNTSDLSKLGNKASVRISEGQEITVFEASLISYFRPDLNKEYKATFPSKDFKSYSEIFETDFNYSSIAVDTKPVFTRLFSKCIKERKFLHSSQFSLSGIADKKSLFEFLYQLPDS
jgi:hypothetical protein